MSRSLLCFFSEKLPFQPGWKIPEKCFLMVPINAKIRWASLLSCDANFLVYSTSRDLSRSHNRKACNDVSAKQRDQLSEVLRLKLGTLAVLGTDRLINRLSQTKSFFESSERIIIHQILIAQRNCSIVLFLFVWLSVCLSWDLAARYCTSYRNLWIRTVHRIVRNVFDAFTRLQYRLGSYITQSTGKSQGKKFKKKPSYLKTWILMLLSFGPQHYPLRYSHGSFNVTKPWKSDSFRSQLSQLASHFTCSERGSSVEGPFFIRPGLPIHPKKIWN